MSGVPGYGFFQWTFWILAFACAYLVLGRVEIFSTNSSQRQGHHPGLVFLLWFLTIGFALSGFVTAILAMRASYPVTGG